MDRQRSLVSMACARFTAYATDDRNDSTFIFQYGKAEGSVTVQSLEAIHKQRDAFLLRGLVDRPKYGNSFLLEVVL